MRVHTNTHTYTHTHTHTHTHIHTHTHTHTAYIRSAHGGAHSAVNCTSEHRSTTSCAEKWNERPDSGSGNAPTLPNAISALAPRNCVGGNPTKNSAHSAVLSRSAGNGVRELEFELADGAAGDEAAPRGVLVCLCEADVASPIGADARDAAALS